MNSVNVWMEEQIPFQVISTTEVRHIIPRVSQGGGGYLNRTKAFWAGWKLRAAGKHEG